MKHIKSILAALVLACSGITPAVIVTSTAVTVVGCASVWQGTVTLTATVYSASKEYAHAYNQGLVPTDVDAKATEAHAAYQKSAGIAASALKAYKLSGDSTQYDAAFAEALKAANEFVNLIVPFITNAKATDLKLNLLKANTL